MKASWQRAPILPKGILVASDQNLEWLLPWWWENYCSSNSLPVTFVDFGMSESARSFCKEHGELLDFAFDPTFVKKRENLHPEVNKKWKNYGKTFWEARDGWFKKPLAMLQTHFAQTLWLDLDCEVLKPLEPIFDLLSEEEHFGIVPEPLFYQGGPDLLFGEVLYNSGVVLFRHGSTLLQTWAQRSLKENAKFLGDQDLLSRIIFEQKIPVVQLPEIYNARLVTGIPFHATIIHWVGNWGKAFLRHHGGLKEMKF